MYPNPQDVLPLPASPDLDQYRKRAKELVRACRSGDDAVHSWAAGWVDRLFALQGDTSASARLDSERRARQVAEFARDRLAPDCALSQAQFVIARAHGFPSWPKLVHHIEAISGADADRSAFERAADAIVAGDLAGLERLLRAHPGLVHARSDREHRATLLHYVSANGVENYRQKTPANIVAIARRLLDAGADVDAEADVYGGGATTLGLAVTSAHPRLAGVQNELANLLLERGARIDAGIVRGCLMNGCPEAGAHMATRGASIDLEEAAGIGRLDLVARWFEPPRTESPADAASALIMASWYDRRDVVSFLLDHGVAVGTRAPKDGDTALHIAAYNGHVALVDLLLQRGAPVNVTDDVYHTPPLVWAMHAWLVENRSDAEAYRTVLRMLADAGAVVKPEWLDDDRLRADPDLFAALSRRVAAT
ncbi:MAG TPA: ankyrin repeat domain-containing protein [Longimicrobiales bacterium]